VDDRNRGVYERHGMAPFTPFPNRPVTLAYFAVPAEVIEDPNMLAEWARGAIDAARTRDKPRRGTRG
jgi:DNA transformation protein